MEAYRILIVDDQREVRRMLRSALETLRLEIKVTDVPSGEEAILIISRQPVDLLISDVYLPGISGLELKDRAMLRNPDMRMILITGVEDRRVRQKVVEADVDAYFFKPLDMESFLATVLGFIQATALPDKDAPPPAVSEPAAPPPHLGQPLEPEDEPPETPTLSSRLTGLRRVLKANSALLFDARGEIIAQAGELPLQMAAVPPLQMLGGMLENATRFSLLMGVNLPRGLMFFPGSDQDLYLTHVGQNVGLLMALNSEARQEEHLCRVMREARLAAFDLLEMLVDWGVQVTTTPASPYLLPEQETTLAEEAGLAEVLPELDAIFDAQTTNAAQSLDADAFWDDLAQHPELTGTSSDALTYEQARQLGLAPDGN